MTSTALPVRWCASVLLLAAAGTHIPLVQDHLVQAPYIGWLFILLSVVCLALAIAILVVDEASLWLLSGLTCFAAVVAVFASRTVGLPQIGDEVGNWTEPLSFPAVAAELLMTALAVWRLRREHRGTTTGV